MKRFERYSWIGLFLALAMLIPVENKSIWQRLIEPVPYHSVELQSQWREGNWLYTVHNFVKNDCDIIRLVTLGNVYNTTAEILREDLNGYGDDYDRTHGEQTLRSRFWVDAQQYEWIDMRTTHDCDGVAVDKLFARINPVIELNPPERS